MSLYDKVDETSNEQMLMEMTQVDVTKNSYNIYMYIL